MFTINIMNVNHVNTITNALLLKYDQKFNKLYDTKLNVNSTIMNKEEILSKENQMITEKDTMILVLQYVLLFVFLFGALLMAHAFRKINTSRLIFATLFMVLLFSLFLYRKVYNHLTLKSLVHNVKAEMKAYRDDVKDYQCPSDCTSDTNGPYTGEEGDDIQSYRGNVATLRIDPQTNVWKYGDIPEDLWTSDKKPASDFYTRDVSKNIPNYNATIEEELANRPKPFFGSTFPVSTYYTCEWMGGHGNETSLPMLERNKYSSIPCSYKPNFTETGRYICTDDPNKRGIDGDISEICDAV